MEFYFPNFYEQIFLLIFATLSICAYPKGFAILLNQSFYHCQSLSVHMKLLFIANRVPYPPYRGDKLKIYNLCRRLAAKGHEIHLITFAEEKKEYDYLPILEGVFKKIQIIYQPFWKSALSILWYFFQNNDPMQVSYFRSAKFDNTLKKLLSENTYDGIHVQHLRMAQYLLPTPPKHAILDLPDAFSLYWERRNQTDRPWYKRWFDSIEQKRVKSYEAKILSAYQKCLVCSAEDLGYLKNLLEKEGTFKNQLGLLPNGVDLDTFKVNLHHDYSHNHTLLFTGNMDYEPNVDAVIYFVNDIFPSITEKFPNTKFIIAGQRPIDNVKALACSNVAVTGFIEDLSVTYDSASIVVAPLRFGAGTQNKVLEAMAMGIPVVCSHIGFAGLGIESGEGAIMQQEKEAFTLAVIDLLGSESQRKEIGQKGLEVMRSRFSWDGITGILEREFN
jgi:polysaccharide biosynthesis protein PslH